MMKPSDVTQEMVAKVCKEAGCCNANDWDIVPPQKIVAAAVNAVRDESPITAEWLETFCKNEGVDYFELGDVGGTWVDIYTANNFISADIRVGTSVVTVFPTSRHQLLSLLEGLGINTKGNQ